MRRITATLSILRRIDGASDRYGNPVVTFGEGEAWSVFAVAPRSSTEPTERARDVVVSGIQVFAPIDGPAPGPHDRVVYAGEEWGVVGDVAVWDRNPHFFVTSHRGIVVNLERIEG